MTCQHGIKVSVAVACAACEMAALRAENARLSVAYARLASERACEMVERRKAETEVAELRAENARLTRERDKLAFAIGHYLTPHCVTMDKAPDQIAMLEHAVQQSAARAEQAEAERDIYRAVLEGAGYERLDDLPSHPGGVAFARAIGEQARKGTLQFKAERDALRANLINVLASARPNQRDHPTMWAAWQDAREALSASEGQ